MSESRRTTKEFSGYVNGDILSEQAATIARLERENEALRGEVASVAGIQIHNSLRWYPDKQEWECIFCIRKSKKYADMVHRPSCHVEDLKCKIGNAWQQRQAAEKESGER